jgi:hypothetical protein
MNAVHAREELLRLLNRLTVYYVSLMMREGPLPAEAPGEADPRQRQHESARLTFRSSADYCGDRVSFGLPAGRTPHIELADFIRFTGAPVPEAQTLLWVAKVVARRRGEDEVFFRVYQEVGSLNIVEPSSPLPDGQRSSRPRPHRNALLERGPMLHPRPM